jgi:large subunit ribosomal protein L29
MADKAKDLRDLAADALSKKVKDSEAKLFDLKMQNSLGKLENSSQVRTLRRDIARAKTVLGEKAAKAAAK